MDYRVCDPADHSVRSGEHYDQDLLYLFVCLHLWSSLWIFLRAGDPPDLP
jgi:hypothetical protein